MYVFVLLFVLGVSHGFSLGFTVDPNWPQPLPNSWIFGAVSGVCVDSDDNIWVIQRPESLTEYEKGASLDPPVSVCCYPAPPVMQFDQDGVLLQAWGGPGTGYEWPSQEHSIFVDEDGYVWISGSGDEDGQVLKFTNDGTFVLQIGFSGPQTNSNDTSRLGKPAGLEVDTVENEIYIADGYYNHRVIVFDSNTGAFKRYWGAYGRLPNDSKTMDIHQTNPPSPIPAIDFANPVHFARLSNDGFLYVGDRTNDRIQIFLPDGTFVNEFFLNPATAFAGSCWDLVFSNDPSQQYIYLADGTNNLVLTLQRSTMTILNTYGRQGRYAGQFHYAHGIAIDSTGNLYIGEVDDGMRVQKLTPL